MKEDDPVEKYIKERDKKKRDELHDLEWGLIGLGIFILGRIAYALF